MKLIKLWSYKIPLLQGERFCLVWKENIMAKKNIKWKVILGLRIKFCDQQNNRGFWNPFLDNLPDTIYYIYIYSNLCHSCWFDYKQRANVSCSLTMAFTDPFVKFCICCNLSDPNIFMKVIHLWYIIRMQPEELRISDFFFGSKIPLFLKKLCRYDVLTKMHFQIL